MNIIGWLLSWCVSTFGYICTVHSLKMLTIILHPYFGIMLKITDTRHFPFNKNNNKITSSYRPLRAIYVCVRVCAFYLYVICWYSMNYIKLRLPSQIIKCKICAAAAATAWARTLEHDSTNVMHIIFIYLIRSLFYFSLYFALSKRRNEQRKVFLCLSPSFLRIYFASIYVILFALVLTI